MWRHGFAALLLAALLILAGCASEGPLKPPSLNLPAPVRGLTASRMGDAVALHWNTPGLTTDGVSLTGKRGAGALMAEVCRSEVAATPCGPVARVPVAASTPGSFQDDLPPSLTVGPARPVHYRVRILNGSGGGGAYISVDALAGTALPPVTGLKAVPVANGVAIHWLPDPAAGGDRILLRVVRGILPAADSSGKAPRELLLALEPAAQDPGGAIDSGAKAGVTQTYTVSRSRTVHTAGGQDLTMSSPAATVTVSANAVAAPPMPPAGVEAVANTLAAPEIDLVWQPAEGAAAYRVYRAQDGGAAALLTTDPVHALTYADRTVRSGVRYRYSVASVSAIGSAGARSNEVTESIPAR